MFRESQLGPVSEPIASAARMLNTASPEEKQQLVAAIDPQLWPRSDAGKIRLWTIILVGLFVLAVLSLGAGLWLYLKGKDGTAIVAITSAVVAGIFGLFANPPTEAGGGPK